MPEEQQQEGGKEEKKEPSRLESLVSEGMDFLKKIGTIGMVALMPYTAGIINPGLVAPAQAFSYPMTAGKATANVIQKKPALEGVIKESVVTTTMAYPLSGMFSGLNSLETALTADYGAATAKSIKAGTWLAAGQPAAVGMHTTLNYGIGKKFREEIWPRLKQTWKYLALPSALNIMFIAPYSILAAMAVSGGISYAFSVMQASHGEKEGSFKNLTKSLNPIPYAKATYTVAQKTAKGVYDTGYSMFRAVYELGDSINKKYIKGGAKPSPQPTPEPQPAPA